MDLELSEVTKCISLKQTHPWILIKAITSEKTVVPARMRSVDTQKKHPASTRPVQTPQNNHSAEEAKRILLQAAKDLLH